MRRGEVVALAWQFSDLTGSKVRPAVVVQADFLGGLIDDTILLKITGRRFGIPGTEVIIDPAVETAAGLSKLCYVSYKDILTRNQTLILRTLGVLSNAAMLQVEVCLKAVLGIP